MNGPVLTKLSMVTCLSPPYPLSKRNLTQWPIASWNIEKNHDISKIFALTSAEF